MPGGRLIVQLIFHRTFDEIRLIGSPVFLLLQLGEGFVSIELATIQLNEIFQQLVNFVAGGVAIVTDAPQGLIEGQRFTPL